MSRAASTTPQADPARASREHSRPAPTAADAPRADASTARARSAQGAHAAMRSRQSYHTLPMIALVALVLLASFLAAYLVLGRHLPSSDATQSIGTSERASQREAEQVIASLDGWWKTGRTLDGRYWHFQDGTMETYAADGSIASQRQLDPDSVERMSAGPDDIGVAGYYLRDIAFYLGDDDPDLLRAIAQDGTADPASNLQRCSEPVLSSSAQEETTATSDNDDYLLPESATRVYDVSELESLSNHELFVARNEIYARHGYVFDPGELADYFASKSWYQPSEAFNEGEISEIERQNVSAILSVEQSRGSQYL